MLSQLNRYENLGLYFSRSGSDLINSNIFSAILLNEFGLQYLTASPPTSGSDENGSRDLRRLGLS